MHPCQTQTETDFTHYQQQKNILTLCHRILTKSYFSVDQKNKNGANSKTKRQQKNKYLKK